VLDFKHSCSEDSPTSHSISLASLLAHLTIEQIRNRIKHNTLFIQTNSKTSQVMPKPTPHKRSATKHGTISQICVVKINGLSYSPSLAAA
jgi:hypothetical protein